MARLHALDRVAVLVHVEDAEPDGERIERVDALLPVLVKGLRIGRVANRAEALRPAEVVDAVHRELRRAYRRATPISESRVTIAASCSSLQPSVCGGRAGSTM